MKVELSPLTIHRGDPVEIGNIYACNRPPPAFKGFRIVVGKATTDGSGRIPWNNVIMIHINASGDVVGLLAAADRIRQEQMGPDRARMPAPGSRKR